jgi:asparagine synthase (glutamine-hydrolysing)
VRDRSLLRAYVRNHLRAVMNDVLAHGELVGSGMIRAGVLAYERARRKDDARQIWQLLTMELRYRNVRSVGVAA